MKKGVVISVINNKGGCAKTSTVVALSRALTKEGKRVLTIDVDSQCNATSILLGGERPTVRTTLYEILDPKENVNVADSIQPTSYPLLSLLPNVPESASLEPDLINLMPNSISILRDRVREYAITEYNYTILDLPPNLGMFVICALMMSDFALIPNEASSRYSFEGLVKAFKFVASIKEKSNPDLRFLRLLLTKADRRTRVCHDIIEQVRNYFPPDKVFSTVIPMNTDIQRAEFEAKTILDYKPGSPGALAYRELAREIIAILKDA